MIPNMYGLQHVCTMHLRVVEFVSLIL